MIKTEKICDRVFFLTDSFNCGSCLVVGSKRALLYDTGCGVDDVAEAVREITDLPLTVIVSHGHFDHIGGSRFFDKVYMSYKDRCILEEYDEELLNKWIRELASGKIEQDMEEQTVGQRALGFGAEIGSGKREDIVFGCNGWRQVLPLEETNISLGDISGEVIEIPGHSLGSVGVLFPDLKLLLGSDALEPVMCLMFKNHGDRHQQYESLKKVSQLDFDQYLTSHSDKLFSKDLISTMIECIEKCEKKTFFEYDYPRPPYSKGFMRVYSVEDEPVGIIISEEENQRRLEE
jgi:glyoxylase-like metal-dependent hydrolase (beta-lactamase superfamily II)